jgi:ADP-glucose pyrophosphorylase
LKKKTTDDPVALIVACPCSEENVSKHGIIELDSDGKVTSFLEKPKPTETSSRLQSPCFYILDAKCQGILDEFLEASKDLPLEKKVLFCRIFQQLKKQLFSYLLLCHLC